MNLRAVLFAGCLGGLGGCDPVEFDPPDTTDRSEVLMIKAVANPDLDLLFVIDDSASMADKQAALATAFPAFLAELATIEGGPPNLHIGVISSDMGTKGSAVEEPGPPIGPTCSMAGKNGILQQGTAVLEDAYAIVNRDGSKNFTGDVAATFGQMASLGTMGCGFEQHLHAMRTSFSQPMNAGFLRPSANLGVIILADEDDCSIKDPKLYELDTTQFGPLQSFRCFEQGVECSPDNPREIGAKQTCKPRATSPYVEDVAPFKDALLAQKGGDARKIMLGMIVAPAAPVAVEINSVEQLAVKHACTITAPSMIVADPAVRLEALLTSFPGRTSLATVCASDLTPSATELGKSIKRLVGDACLERPLANPAAPDCIVEDVRDSAPASGAPTEIESCATAGEDVDCYELVPDAACSKTPHLRLSVARALPPADDTWTRVRCVVPQL
ncbi:MAG: hypothetical protein WKG01_09340 [Kofleriaceae bacterium]